MQYRTMCRRRTATALSAAATAVCCLQILGSIPTASAGSASAARRTVYYQDAACSLATFQEYAYDATSIDTDGSTSQVGFDECYARGSTGAITTCDTSTGISTIETYLDTSCQVHLYSSADSPACVNLKVEGETCPPGGPASETSDCVAREPAESLSPGIFNLVGSPYKDKFCTERTGGDHVVSGHAFGVGAGYCSRSPLVRGPRYAVTECRDDSIIFAKVYAPDDYNCSGDMRLEMLVFPDAVSGDRIGGVCALGTFEDGTEEYYRLNSCTTEGETPKNNDIGPTPAPTPAPEGSETPDHVSPPVDYRGDGDDEDLRDDSEDSSDDNDNDHDNDNDDRHSSSSSDDDDDDKHTTSSSTAGGMGDSGEVDPGESEDDDDDCTESKDDDSDDSSSDSSESRDTGTHGDGDGGGGGGGGDGLTDDAVYAIAFGVSVAVVTAALSALLAFAGADNGKKKIAPKCDS